MAPAPDPQPGQTVRCVGAVVLGPDGLLLVRRANPPGQGRWSVPGGRVEPGESDEQAVRREVREETGLQVEVVRRLGSVRIPATGPAPGPAPGPVVYDVHDLACRVTGGRLLAGDDAAAAAFVPLDRLDGFDLVDGLLAALRGWGALDARLPSS